MMSLSCEKQKATTMVEECWVVSLHSHHMFCVRSFVDCFCVRLLRLLIDFLSFPSHSSIDVWAPWTNRHEMDMKPTFRDKRTNGHHSQSNFPKSSIPFCDVINKKIGKDTSKISKWRRGNECEIDWLWHEWMLSWMIDWLIDFDDDEKIAQRTTAIIIIITKQRKKRIENP